MSRKRYSRRCSAELALQLQDVLLAETPRALEQARKPRLAKKPPLTLRTLLSGSK